MGLEPCSDTARRVQLPTKPELENARAIVLSLIDHFETAGESIGQEAWIGLSLTEHFLNDLVNGLWGADKWH